MEATVDMSSPAEPAVGGLTGRQLALLRELEQATDDLCEYEMFPASRQGPAEYCGNEAEPWSSFCSDHQQQETDWDQIAKDLRHGYDD